MVRRFLVKVEFDLQIGLTLKNGTKRIKNSLKKMFGAVLCNRWIQSCNNNNVDREQKADLYFRKWKRNIPPVILKVDSNNRDSNAAPLYNDLFCYFAVILSSQITMGNRNSHFKFFLENGKYISLHQKKALKGSFRWKIHIKCLLGSQYLSSRTESHVLRAS